MSVDASAVARVVGVATKYVDLRAGGTAILPQRVMILAQGATAVTYPTTKQPITNSLDAGNIYGWGSPIHKIARELFPDNNDGVGTIPVTVYPLVDDASGVAAIADITPSGTTTAQGTYYVRMGGTLSLPFVIPSGPAVVNDRCRVMGKAVAGVLRMPMLGTYAYGAVTSAAGTNTGNGTCTALSVTGTPVPGAWTLVNNTAVVNGGVWTLTDPDANVISTTVTQTVGAGSATVLNVGGIQFTITDGATDFAVGDKFTITVPATKLNLTTKWKGATGNDLIVEVIGPSPSVGAVFTITAPHNGAVNPSVSAALALVGNVWETMVINQMGTEDGTTLDLISAAGEGRWGQTVKKPFLSFCGNTKASVTTATSAASARKTDRVNVELVAPGSVALPFVEAARQVARIVVQANNNPASSYATLPVDGIIPGTDDQQWDYATRDLAIKAGCSTVEVVDSVIQISDVVTMYHPDGDLNPAYRYVVSVVKLMNVIFSTNLIFTAPEWATAPLIPDDQPTVNPNARRPRSAKSEIAAMLDGLGLNALISDPKSAKKTITAVINSGNPNRLDVAFTVQLSGNSNIISTDVAFGFFFGSPALAA